MIAEPDARHEKLARLGTEVFATVLPSLRPEDDGKFVAVDVRTGQFDIDEDDYTAVMRLRSRLPDAEIWLERVGQPAAHSMRPAR